MRITNLNLKYEPTEKSSTPFKPSIGSSVWYTTRDGRVERHTHFSAGEKRTRMPSRSFGTHPVTDPLYDLKRPRHVGVYRANVFRASYVREGRETTILRKVWQLIGSVGYEGGTTVFVGESHTRPIC